MIVLTLAATLRHAFKSSFPRPLFMAFGKGVLWSDNAPFHFGRSGLPNLTPRQLRFLLPTLQNPKVQNLISFHVFVKSNF